MAISDPTAPHRSDASGARPDDGASDPAAKLTLDGVWKIFGHGAGAELERHGGRMSPEQLAAAGLVGAVRDVNLRIREGEIFVIMGLSGSGKSTIVRCMAGLLPITAGHIFIESSDLWSIGAQELLELRRHKMGMVFQHFALLPHLTVLANVAFPLEVQGVDKATREEAAREKIRLVGLEGREHNFPRQLSGGQQQRVGIARALVIEPDIWFLDEPFSALDPLIRGEMQDEFLRLQAMLHKTVVFITHDFAEAIRLADRIAIMHEGGIDQIGTPEEIVTQPASDYVAEFTKGVPRQKVLTARRIMDPDGGGDASDGGEPPIRAHATVDSFAARVIDRDGPVPVADADGRLIGQVRPDQVLDVLLDRKDQA